MQLLKANTAVDVLIGPFVDDTDGKTAETGLTLSQADIKLSKNGQALAQKNDATAAAHDANGYHNCELDATDTNTEGTLVLIVHETGALPVRHEYMVLAEAAYDSLFTAKDTGYMDVNVKAVSEDTTAADNLESACDNYSVTRGLAGTALPAAAADDAGGLPISDAGGLDLDTQIGTDIDAILADTAEIQGKLPTNYLMGSSDVNDHDTDIDAILVDTNSLNDTKIPDTISLAAINAQVDAALVDINLDHLCAAATAGADMTTEVVDNSILSRILAAGDTSNFAPSTDSLQNIRDELVVVDGIVDNILTDTNELQTDDIPGTLSTIDGKIDTIDGIVDDILVDTGTTLDGKINTLDTNVDSILADTGTDGVVVATASKTGYTLSDAGVDALFDRNSSLSISFEALLERTYEMVNNKMTVNETTGAVALRNIGDSADIATGSVTSSSGTTTRNELSWV